MKRTIIIKGRDGEISLEVKAKVNTGSRGLTKGETERVVRDIAKGLYDGVTRSCSFNINFDPTNTTLSV